MSSLELIKQIEEEFSGYYNKQEFKNAACMYSEDGILIPPHVPNLVGVKAIEDFLRGFYEQGAVKLEVNVQSADLINDSSCLEMSNFIFYKNDNSVLMKGRWMTYWKKNNDGDWKCIYDTLSPL